MSAPGTVWASHIHQRLRQSVILLSLGLIALIFSGPTVADASTAGVLPPQLARQARPAGIDCTRAENWAVLNGSLQSYCDGTWDEKVFWASSDAPIARSLPASTLGDLTFFVDQMAAVTERARLKRRAEYLAVWCPVPALNSLSHHDHEVWLRSSRHYVHSLRLPPLHSHCITTVAHRANTTAGTIRRARSLTAHLATAAGNLQRAARAGSSAPPRRRGPVDRIVNGWGRVVGDISGVFADPVYKCEVWNVAGVRVRGRWGIFLKVTSHDVYATPAEGERQYLHEVIAPGAGGGGRGVRFGALRATAWERGEWREARSNSTTTVANWGGRPEVSHFFRQPVASTAALQRLLAARRHDEALVQDTVAWSNVAILAFPIFMTLVPISSIDYVQMPLVLLYAAFTDVLSTLPMFVKGLELLAFPDAEGCDSWTHGIEAPDPMGTAIIETWCASCGAKHSFRATGYAFLACSLAFMAVGVAAEIIARRRLVARMTKGHAHPRRFWKWGDEDSEKSKSEECARLSVSDICCCECRSSFSTGLPFKSDRSCSGAGWSEEGVSSLREFVYLGAHEAEFSRRSC